MLEFEYIKGFLFIIFEDSSHEHVLIKHELISCNSILSYNKL